MNIKPLHNQKEWETFFLRYGSEALFQSWEWGETLEKSGLKIERFGMIDGDKLNGIFQIIKVVAKRGSFLHIRHGPIFQEYSSEVLSEFTEFMCSKAKKDGVLFFRISPLVSQDKQNLFTSHGYKDAAIHAMDAEVCWVLSLEKPVEQIFSDMRKTTRYEIRKAEKMGITVEQSTNLDAFFELYDETSKRHEFIQHKGIREEFDVFSKRDEALLYYAKYEGKIIATAIVLFLGTQGIYHHGASLHSSPPGSYLIQWHAIQEVKKRGMKQYNFWGIAPDDNQDHPWKGITLFKKGFGGEERRHLHAQDYPISPLYIFPKAIETIRRIKKGY